MLPLSRRSFIKSTTAASTGLLFIPDLLKNAPNNRLNIAVIGVGGRGRANWDKVPQENIVFVHIVNLLEHWQQVLFRDSIKKKSNIRIYAVTK